MWCIIIPFNMLFLQCTVVRWSMYFDINLFHSTQKWAAKRGLWFDVNVARTNKNYIHKLVLVQCTKAAYRYSKNYKYVRVRASVYRIEGNSGSFKTKGLVENALQHFSIVCYYYVASFIKGTTFTADIFLASSCGTELQVTVPV
jgi:hypothetical protein